MHTSKPGQQQPDRWIDRYKGTLTDTQTDVQMFFTECILLNQENLSATDGQTDWQKDTLADGGTEGQKIEKRHKKQIKRQTDREPSV